MILKINYGLNRRIEGKSKKHIEHKCGKIEVEGTWEDDETHDLIRKSILYNNTGWNLTGYACTNKTIKQLYKRN